MILVPSIVLLLDPTSPNPIHALAVQHLLSIAGQAPAAFKQATNTLEPKERERLETSIRQTVASSQPAPAKSASAVKPQISLKSFS